MSEDEDDDRFHDWDDGTEPECLICGGEGFVDGADLAPMYDYGWIDETRMYTCTSCRGSGLAKDMTWC
jgi:hypothetical protein